MCICGAELGRRSDLLPRPELATLLRDAEPLWRGELDLQKRAENERRRGLADAELFRMYRNAKSSNRLDGLPYEVRSFYEGLMPAFPSEPPRRRKRSPKNEGRRLKIAVAETVQTYDRMGWLLCSTKDRQNHSATKASVGQRSSRFPGAETDCSSRYDIGSAIQRLTADSRQPQQCSLSCTWFGNVPLRILR